MSERARNIAKSIQRWIAAGVPGAVGSWYRRFVYLQQFVATEINHWKLWRGPLRLRMGFWRRGFLSRSAVLYGLQKLEDTNDYLSDFRRSTRSWRANQPFDAILNDKLVFFLSLRTFTKRVVPVVGLIDKAHYMPIAAEKKGMLSLADGLQEVRGKVVLKPSRGSMGKGILFYENRGGEHWVNDRQIAWSGFEKSLSSDTFIVSPFVQQAEYAANVFPKATNTIRMLTMWDYEAREPFVAAAVHRFGTEASGSVDNFAAGGMTAAIDPDTGCIGKAASFPVNGELVWRTEHPDSGVQIAGEVVPHWSLIMGELLEIAKRLPFLPYVGWDLVVADGGFWILEGNSCSSLGLIQLHAPLLKDDRVRRFYEYHGVLDGDGSQAEGPPKP